MLPAAANFHTFIDLPESPDAARHSADGKWLVMVRGSRRPATPFYFARQTSRPRLLGFPPSKIYREPAPSAVKRHLHPFTCLRKDLVELVGLEPTASSLRTTRSPN